MEDAIDRLEKELLEILEGFVEQVNLRPGSLMVIGCSTSEVAGRKIGTAGTMEIAEVIYRQLDKLCEKTGVKLAFQCCEHLNRALVVERSTVLEHNLEEVSVIPVRHAGGAMATYAFNAMEDAVVVESIQAEAGIDIGDTLIGMHLKKVAVPIRVARRRLGEANVTLAKTRPKLIGGPRAVYERTTENLSCT
ncbi:TIGR01440 family protein [Bacillus sp. FJAT-27225]|uniref:TIGR01440 family protein n=1 Tax=Bacillus sp. FJAT-27225 TaxID=1743144 RepID=UPI00080C2294|nr:TIGR01440 family protein [Bacillus sp. FJAT-27225]OCA82390.1 TIGR01440 family protein [Bacillus sp. FJAT-27225]